MKQPINTACSDDKEEYSLRFRRNDILLQKDAPDRDWYIIVTDKGGYYLYDGYWHNSETEDWKAAYKEAKKGACLK